MGDAKQVGEGVLSDTRVGRRRRGLRRQWLVALAVMLTLVICTGASAVLSSQFVVGKFTATATELERAGAYSARLAAAITVQENIAHALLANGPVKPLQLLGAQRAVQGEFAAGAVLFHHDAGMLRTLDTVHERWRAAFAEVGLWGPEILSFRFRGVDRAAHQALTERLDETSVALLAVDEHARAHLRQDLEEARQSRHIAFGGVGAVLGLALLAMMYFARRMSADVLRPVEALQHGVGRVRAGDFHHQVQLPARQSENELTDLATGFNEMASELASTHRELTFRAMHDSLTGLPNRLALRERLAVEFAQSGGRREQPDVSVLFVDLDDFKVVNDTLGHAGGDELLMQVAQRLIACARSTDTVGRLGGDEFAVVVAGNSGVAGPGVAERMLGAMSAPFVVAGRSVSVTASIGIGTAGPTTSADELLGQADFAMYTAKGQGKHRYEIYDETLHAVTTDHAVLRSDLRRAADNGELRLDYQPVVDLDTGAVVGVEALVRWQHPVRGLVSPLDFIPIAEQSGDIDAIGLWVLRNGMNQLARWRRAGGSHLDLWLAVNLSPVQLRNQRLVAQLADLLSTGPVPADAVVLEITESALVLGVDGAVVALQTLKATGARIALDDFGTGLSSLSTLDGLPVDILKIDRAFVSGQEGGAPSAAVLQTIVALGDHLSLDVIAEGVEEPVQTATLRALGCQFGQGFGLARPASADLITALLQQVAPVVPAQRRSEIHEKRSGHPA
jgi:diguanylate cyclase (GGDEF)-like protein